MPAIHSPKLYLQKRSINGKSINKKGGTSVPPKNVTRINFVANIIQTWIVTIGNDGVALRL
ncbi:MAG: hypothetical protein J6V16_07395, partial [Bacteroidales bacterium]|nr:hypothetical protein [Bacteroidales bacterium]